MNTTQEPRQQDEISAGKLSHRHGLASAAAPHSFGAGGREEPDLIFPANHIRGVSASMQALYREMLPLVQGDLSVLITGETGVGKELIARTCHLSSPRRRGPFVAINCAAVPTELLEAEFFGIADRVATGVAKRPGQLRRAEGGTIFLDEIGEMPRASQAKLLRALEEKEIRPLGSSPVSIDVRVVAATNADISTLMNEGRFRRDLYYRLAGFVLRVPSLRERREDIPLFVKEFLRRFADETRAPVRGITEQALKALVEGQWPGNVRELEHELHRLVYLCPPGRAIEQEMLPRETPSATKGIDGAQTPVQRVAGVAQGATGDSARVRTGQRESLSRELPTLELEALEREAIKEALRRSGGKQLRAAQLLGISRFALHRKLKRLGLLLRRSLATAEVASPPRRTA